MTPWTVARQAPPSMGFPRQEYWSGLTFPSPGDLPDPETESPGIPAMAGRSFTIEPTGKPQGAMTERETVNLFRKPNSNRCWGNISLAGNQNNLKAPCQTQFYFPSKVNIDPITRLAYFKLIQFFFKTTQIGFIKAINTKPVYPLPQKFNF